MRRIILFSVFSVLVLGIFYGPLTALLKMSSRSELYSHIVLIPLVSGYFLYQKRKAVFPEMEYGWFPGTLFLLSGIFLFFIGIQSGAALNQNDYLSLMAFSAVATWIGGFILFFGTKAFRAALFPLLFLFFLVPIPTALVEKIILILQIGSTEVTYLLFKLTGIPIYREGFTFHLSGMSIEVAKECSGIRSSIALFITGIIAGQLFLDRGRNQWILLVSAIPITILKNGMRIVTLSLLGTYVNPAILSSDLHRRGGIPFFIVALLLLAPILYALMRSERGQRRKG